jgi:hypothetical protein
MLRVQIPAYTDAWMRGDRYGVVVKTARKRVQVRPDWPNQFRMDEVHTVKLDRSGKTIRVKADDCQEIA